MSGSSGQVAVGKVLARRMGDEVCFLVVGRGCANHSPALRAYAEESLAAGVTAFQVDLSDCTHCDSTFLGTLLRLLQACRTKPATTLQLANPSAAVRQVLHQMGVTRLFHITEKSATSQNDMTWQQLDDQCHRSQSLPFKQNAVDAHQALASEGGELAQRFGPLAEAMRAELATLQSPKAPCE